MHCIEFPQARPAKRMYNVVKAKQLLKEQHCQLRQDTEKVLNKASNLRVKSLLKAQRIQRGRLQQGCSISAADYSVDASQYQIRSDRGDQLTQMQQQTLLPSSAVMQQAPDTSFDFAPASSASAIHVYQDTSLLQQDFAMQLNQDVSSNEVSEDQDQVHDSDNGFDDGSGNNDDELDDERSFDIDVLGDDEVFVNIGGHQSGRRIQFRSSNPFGNSSPELQSGDDDGFEEDSSPFY